jgi:hypothetical protein
VGATVLALWFLVIDGVQGEPFHTPAFLAQVVLGSDLASLEGVQILIYTILHYAVFVAVGVAVAALLHRLSIVPGILLGAVLGFLLFDLLFYGGVWLTGVDVVGYLGWPAVLAGNILAGTTLVGTVSLLGPEPDVSWRDALARQPTIREGLVVGLIGAVAVALWFLLIDVVAGRILFTPAALGSILFHGATGLGDVRLDAVTILAYTGLHVGAFLATGLLAAAIVAYAESGHEYVLLGAVLLFVSFEAFFIGLLAIVAQWLLAVIPWWSIAVGNLIAAAAMGYYLWRRHPAMAAALGEVELERRVEDDGGARRGGPPVSPGVGGSTGAGPGRP